jgi:hypothetical protein
MTSHNTGENFSSHEKCYIISISEPTPKITGNLPQKNSTLMGPFREQ